MNGKEFEEIERIFEIPQVKVEKTGWFCESSQLSLEDQQWIWDNIPHETKSKKETNDNVSVSENVNDTYKRRVNFGSTQSKQQLIAELKTCNYKTPPKKSLCY